MVVIGQTKYKISCPFCMTCYASFNGALLPVSLLFVLAASTYPLTYADSH